MLISLAPCVPVDDVCSELPYEMTYFPNEFAEYESSAGVTFSQVIFHISFT